MTALDDATRLLHAQQQAFAALVHAQVAAPVSSDVEAHATAYPGADMADALLRRLGGVAPRIDIYQHAYRARLTEALRSNYPVLHRVLGDDDFATLAGAYLHAHPSRTPSIRWFGDRLPDWLAARLEADPQALPHPALADLARMEWAVGSSFDAADATPIEHAALAAVVPEDWPGLTFTAHPSVRMLSLAWAVEPLWRTLTDDEEGATQAPEPLAHDLLVWRHGLDSRFSSLAAGEAQALGACLGGMRFDALCAQVAAGDGASDAGAVAAQVASWMSHWVAAGLLLARPGA